jgi:hypothetical protein
VGPRREHQGETGRNPGIGRARGAPGPQRSAHHVGRQGPRRRDRPGASVHTDRRQAGEAVNEPAGSLVTKLTAAKTARSLGAIPVITPPAAAFSSLRPQLDALIGVIYPSRRQPLAALARQLLGSYGPVTAETIRNSKGRYVAVTTPD